MIQEVDNYLNNLKKWQSELTKLRTLILSCGLTEEFKWMHPCYTHTNKNIVLIHGFKDYCALLFYKGALLKDPENILIQQTKNVQAARQIRFTSVSEIEAFESTIKNYISEAIEIEKKGLKIVKKKTSDYKVPNELTQKFEEDPAFEKAFKKLTPGRQRGYLLHFDKPKQAKSRFSRIEKNTARILDGKGLNDCVCGRSKRMPNCDGSHNELKAPQ
tara:strand:+ start:74222 stop:74869 length:648 start_codon:yes stop_codon:yes gene_type:complete